MNELFANDSSGAVFSDDRKYRYALWRIWDNRKPLVMFIGLNPSTADEASPDNTITRVKGIVENLGYGGFYMMNLFAIVSKEPKILKTHPDPLGDNDGWIEKISAKCEMVVFAWGAFKEAKERCRKIIEMFPNGKALQILNDGSPKHPLYCRKDTQPVDFKSSKLVTQCHK